MLILRPAYGRSYDSVEAIEKDWLEGKDFKIQNGPYCSVRDFSLMQRMGHDIVLCFALGSNTVYKLIHKVSVNGSVH